MQYNISSSVAPHATGGKVATLATGTTLLPIASVRLDGGIQIRDLDETNVERLVEVLRDGGTFRDNPTVWHNGTDYWASHGFHRLEAYGRHGVKEIPVDVQQGTVDDARDDACRPHNAGHGLPETRADRERRFKHALRLHPRWANNRISKLVGGLP